MVLYRPLKFWAKFLAYYGSFLISSIMCFPHFMLHPRNGRKTLPARTFCNIVQWIIGLTYEIRGREHLEVDRACVIVCNHQSSLDSLGIITLWPMMKQCSVIAKKELFYIWPLGLAAWLCGFIFIDRNDVNKTKRILDNSLKNIQDQKEKIWIFPEGTRKNTGEIHAFKKGAFHIAVNHQLPILPVVFSSYYFLSKTEKRFDSGRLIITALPAISTTGLGTKDIPELMKKTRGMMVEVYNAMNDEVQSAITNELQSQQHVV